MRKDDGAGALLLMVDDEPDLLRALDYSLRREGFGVRSAATGAEAIAAAQREPIPELVLLDLMLPDMPGTAVCRALRASPKTADIFVIMLTAKGEERDRVGGFEVGADDYVVKPFSVRELVLRIRAGLRRARAADAAAAAVAAAAAAAVAASSPSSSFSSSSSSSSSSSPSSTSSRSIAPPPTLRHGAIEVDVVGHRVHVGGAPVNLTALEFSLLQALLERRDGVQTRQRLLTDVWGYAPEVTTRTVDTHIKRLRAKLGEAGAVIETVRGVGYCVRSETDLGASADGTEGA
jgi:two-component system phosphate regulon response regulator PhoB